MTDPTDDPTEAPPRHGDRITEMYAWCVVDPRDDCEGVIAHNFGGPDAPPMMMPLVGADTARAEALTPVAQSMADTFGTEVFLLRFTVREEAARLTPGGGR